MLPAQGLANSLKYSQGVPLDAVHSWEPGMSLETIGLILGIWFAAGIGFCALWALAHRKPRDRFAHAKALAHQLSLR